MSYFSDKLKKLRKNKNLTQQQMADEFGINRVSYARWENGSRKPSSENLIKLVAILGTTFDYLFGRSEKRTRCYF